MRKQNDILRIRCVHNPAKVWRIKRYRSGNFFVNQLIDGHVLYTADVRMTYGTLRQILPNLDYYWKRETNT